MRVIFLDIDGVLITEASSHYFRWINNDNSESDAAWRRWCPVGTSNLHYLLEKVPDLKIVLSSCWRTGRTTTECADLLQENGLDRNYLIGRTGRTVYGQPRGIEIQLWLDEHPEVTDFVIIDDESDMAHLMEHLYKTEFSMGLTIPIVNRIVEHFKLKDPHAGTNKPDTYSMSNVL